MEFKVGI